MARLTIFRNILFALFASLGFSCEECAELHANEYGYQGNAAYLRYAFPAAMNTYSSFILLENGFVGRLPDSSGQNTLTIYPFSPINTFILRGVTDTDTVVLSDISYSLYKAGKCGLGIEVSKPVMQHSFDSTSISYSDYGNTFDIIIYKP